MQVVKIEQKHSEYLENFFDWLFFASEQRANIAPERNIIYKDIQQLQVTYLSFLVEDTICGEQMGLILLLLN